MAPSHEERIKALKAKREAFRIEVQELKDILDEPEICANTRDIPHREISLRLEELQLEYASFAKNQQDLDSADETGDLLRDRMKLKSFYIRVRAQALDILPATNAQSSDAQTNHSSSLSQNESFDIDVQLPKINLPTFSGNYEDWPGFADQFKSAVHSNIRISDCKKLTYLRSCLKGEALKGIESLTNSEANYRIAWAILEKQYNQPAIIVSNHLKALFDLPNITRPAHQELRSFLNNVEAHYRSLQPFNQPTPDTLLIHLLLRKIDKDTALKWREYTRKESFPKLETFFQFMHERCQVLEPLANHHLSHSTPATSIYTPRSHIPHKNQILDRGTPRPSFRDNRQQSPQVYATQVTISCSFCKEAHYSQQCETFTRLSIPDRHQLVHSKKLCFNCLRSNHNTDDCRSTTCRRCHKKHHTLLHQDDVENPPTAAQAHITCLNSHFSSEIVLATAVIEILDNSGQTHLCRVLLDSCSHAHFLSHKFCNKLDLTYQRTAIPLSGTNNMSSTISRQTNATIKSRYNGYSQALTFLVVNRVSQKVPTTAIDHKTLQIPQNLPLADPSFFESSEVDGLLGAQIFWDLLSVGCIKLANNDTKMYKTKLGWVIVGEMIKPFRQAGIICNVVTNSLEQQISKFWELEERSVKKHLSPEEHACEVHYLQHTRRDAGSGRYSVNLPFKENINKLGESYPMALKRFLALERQLDRNPHIKEQYSAFLREYHQLGHMSLSPNSFDGYFLPHHAVTKVDSLTTKIRVVFDASAKTSSGISLNDILMIGPTIQDDLFTLISRFRTHNYVLTADITKMYRQIELSPEDRKYHKILWRENCNQPLQTFHLNTVTYGTASAPFLATRTLQQLAREEGSNHAIAAQVLQNDFYVDDLLTGAPTLKEAEVLRDQLILLTTKGGFQLRQWASNDSRLIQPLKNTHDQHMTLDLTDSQKTLGLFWHPQTDTIGYTVKNHDTPTNITKRNILSRIAQLFDPLGLLGPIIVKAKLIMQELWKLNLHWDESVPFDLHSLWTEFQMQLPLIEKFKFPRSIISKHAVSVELHGFSDASERAYGACLYLRSTDSYGSHFIKLICSKSRVAPLKTQSLPRLELCAAVLLINLCKSITQALQIKFTSISYWTDSMITLHWIRTPPHTLKQFVANRVSEIQQDSTDNQWRHVPSADNPADILSRGINPTEFLKSQIWTNGPLWLRNDETHWPKTTLTSMQVPEQRPVTVMNVTIKPKPYYEILRKFSTLATLIRIVAYCHRFRNNTLKKTKNTGQLTIEELQYAHRIIIKLTQIEEFQNEFEYIRQGTGTKYKGRLIALKPFIDSTGLIRVGGRLTNSNLSYNHKHPLVLPDQHPVTDLIIKQYHLSHGHAGTQATLNAVRQKYWPINGKVRVKTIIRKCVLCSRARPTIPDYQMGTLPKHRVTFTRPFLTSGVDYCGPFHIKEKKLRNTRKVKCYVAVFVCLATKAVHLELVSDLTTDAFIAALRRFLARRGKPTDIYSDNATNFIGANREIKEIYKLIRSKGHNDNITRHLSNESINWHFIPPRAPHFGGIWEAAVKSLKHHTTRLLQHTLFTYEAFTTCLTEIEAILNSRPLTPLSSDPTDLTALTPGHFLIGDSITSIPERDFTATNTGRLSNWQQAQQLRQHFWSRWHREYLNELTVRQKWHRYRDADIREGMLVILKEDNLPPLCWPLGRIISTHPGQDGTVRVVTVKTAHGTYKRATKGLAPLPINVE